MGNAQGGISLVQGNTTFESSLAVNFGIYNEQGTQLIDFGTHSLGIQTDHSSDRVYGAYMFDLTFTRSSASDISVSASFDQMAIPVNPIISEFPDTYTGFNVNLGTDTVTAGLNAYDNLYVGMGHTIADQNQVALSGSSYDGLSTQNFTVVPEPGSVLLTVLTGGVLLGLRRRR